MLLIKANKCERDMKQILFRGYLFFYMANGKRMERLQFGTIKNIYP